MDMFRGNNQHLIDCAHALLDLDKNNALSPHGLGGHARTIIESLNARFESIIKERDELRQQLEAINKQEPVCQIHNAGFVTIEDACKIAKLPIGTYLYTTPLPAEPAVAVPVDTEITDAMASAFNQAICDDALNDQDIEQVKIGLRAAILHLQPLPLSFYELEIKRLVAINDSLLANERRLIERLRHAPCHSRESVDTFVMVDIKALYEYVRDNGEDTNIDVVRGELGEMIARTNGAYGRCPSHESEQSPEGE